MTHPGRSLQRSVNTLGRLAAAPSTKSPERIVLERIAIEAAADGRECLQVYRERGDEAARAERDYRKVQHATSELLAHLKAVKDAETPPADWPGWERWPRVARQDGEPYPLPVDVKVGELKTAKQFEVALNALCADARYERDVRLSRSRSAGKALAMFDRIINLMQSLMKQDALDERASMGTEINLDWTDDGEYQEP